MRDIRRDMWGKAVMEKDKSWGSIIAKHVADAMREHPPLVIMYIGDGVTYCIYIKHTLLNIKMLLRSIERHVEKL